MSRKNVVKRKPARRKATKRKVTRKKPVRRKAKGKPVRRKKLRKRELGRRSRAAGARFELKVRNALGSKGWIVDKWSNNVDLEEGKLVKVKNKFLGPGKPMMLGAGFPDFIAFKIKGKNYEVIGVEVKTRGYLNKVEKEKCKWYLKNKIFSKISIAKPIRNGRKINIEYIDFRKKYR